MYPCAAPSGQQLAKTLRGQRPLFACVIAWTDTAQIPGISAAGATHELIPFTAAADAEVVVHGRARCIVGVPSNPLGPPGPALITRAALQLAHMPAVVVDAGSRIIPDAPHLTLGRRPGGLISRETAVPNAADLFRDGRELGRRLAAEHDYLVLAESVPGGTTTALALLLALGYAADGRVSSSLAANAHGLKSQIAHEALARTDLGSPRKDADPLYAVSAVGDPMQPAVAGMVAGCIEAGKPVLLAGGTQMVAVLALVLRLAGRGHAPDPNGRLAVATTRWVVEDPTADLGGLMREVGSAPLLATPLSFAESRHPALRLYEQNLVKEGVGAGGAAVASYLRAGITCAELLEGIESLYDELLAETGQDVMRADHVL
jgi:uncharacterized protein (TIGR00303 family)